MTKNGINSTTLKKLKLMGFSFVNGSNKKLSYVATYENRSIATFSIDFSEKATGEINWGDIEENVKSRRSSNLSKPEFFGQLYWVIKLVESGYSPKNIVIEQDAQLGRKDGYIDVLVLDENKEPFMVLDAKTSGREYDTALRDLKKAKGQVASYFSYNSKIKYIGVVSADFLDNFINDESYIVSTEGWAKYGSAKAFSKTLENNEMLNDAFRISKNVSPYDLESIDLYPNDLVELTEESSSKMFHKFLTILRKYGISDKTNAFNKVLNLFIAKIVDEFNTPDNQKLKFQLSKIETKEEFVAKLETLYSKGMRDFIQVNLDSDKELLKIRELISKNISNVSGKEELLRLIEHTQSKASPNFQFKDVYDDESFEDNIHLLQELVALIAPYKLKYPKKQQFLGDFFEMILSNGFKQESGQFFTPVPIARFMVESIPLSEKIDEKLKAANPRHMLPKMIDFASGSGHFLTEYMDSVQQLINNTSLKGLSKATIQKLESYKTSPFDWAENYVYGLDIDYRLVKTSKVSTFLNGDGNAKIRRANGLDSFISDDFVGDLHLNSQTRVNGNFDVLLANPPYHVDEFRQQLPNLDEDFELAKYITENSSEIEAIFIERASQLLDTGGIMGIVLPSSILDTSPSIYVAARKLLLEDFEIRAIVKNPASTFMATGTETVIIFGKKRDKNIISELKLTLESTPESLETTTINGNPNFFSDYVGEVYHAEVVDYFKMLDGTYEGTNIQIQEYYTAYKKVKSKFTSFREFAWEIEKEKMFYYALTENEVVIIQAPKGKGNTIDEQLLGYKFSGRRGQEGIQPRVKNYTIDDLSMLYGEKGVFLNQVIKGAFSGIEVTPDKIVEPFYSKSKLNHNIHFNAADVEFKIRLAYEGKKIIGYEGEETVPLREIADLLNGTSITQDQIEIGEFPVIAGGRTPAYYSSEYNRSGDIITISQSGAYAGFIAYHEKPIFSSDSFTIKAKKSSPYSTKQIYLLLKQKQEEIYKFASGSIQKHVYSSDLEPFRIPVPSDITDLKEFITSISQKAEAITNLESKIEQIMAEERLYINNYVTRVIKESDPTIGRLHDNLVLEIKGGKRIPKELDYAPFKTNHYYPGIGEFEDGTINLGDSKCIDSSTFDKIKAYQMLKNDIYVSAAGTIGKVGKLPNIADDETVSLTENAHRIRISDSSKINQDYLIYVLSSLVIQEKLLDKTAGVGTPKLSIQSLKEIRIPMIDLEKQKEFVKKVNSFKEEINKLILKLDEIE